MLFCKETHTYFMILDEQLMHIMTFPQAFPGASFPTKVVAFAVSAHTERSHRAGQY